MTFTPQIDTFRIGDTFCLKSIIPDLLMDTFSKQEFDVSAFDFGIVNDIARHDTSGYISAEKEFDLINITGEYQIIPIAENVIRSLILYEKFNEERLFEACFVTKKIGLYEIGFFHLKYDGKTLVDSECAENIDINVNMNNEADNNYELLQTSPQAIGTEEVFKRWGEYAFIVIE
jgi:hypothetical protein